MEISSRLQCCGKEKLSKNVPISEAATTSRGTNNKENDSISQQSRQMHSNEIDEEALDEQLDRNVDSMS